MRRKKAKDIYDKYIYVELLVMNTKVWRFPNFGTVSSSSLLHTHPPLPPQAFPKELTDELRERLKQDGVPPPQNLFQKFRIYLLEELQKKYWSKFCAR